MTNEVSAELLKLAEIAPMSAGTRTRIRDAALKVQTLEREHTELAKGWGKSLGEIYGQASAEPRAASERESPHCPTCSCGMDAEPAATRAVCIGGRTYPQSSASGSATRTK